MEFTIVSSDKSVSTNFNKKDYEMKIHSDSDPMLEWTKDNRNSNTIKSGSHSSSTSSRQNGALSTASNEIMKKFLLTVESIEKKKNDQYNEGRSNMKGTIRLVDRHKKNKRAISKNNSRPQSRSVNNIFMQSMDVVSRDS